MKKIARKEIFGIKPYVPGKPIEEVKRELGLKEAIKLASNESPFPPSRKATLAAKKALRTVNRYPDGGSFYLKRKLAKHLKVKPENLVIGNGSDEVIIFAIRALVKKDEEVIIAKPTFLIYEIASKLCGAKIKFAPLKDYKYDVNKIISLITKKTKLIFIANPDNPLGRYITDKEVELLISKTPKNCVIFFDEAYYEFASDLKDFPNTIKYINRKNIIVSRSFSKAYGMAGLRVGYGIAKKEMIECLNKVREPFNVNSIAQAAAFEALSDQKYVKKIVESSKKSKIFFYNEFDKVGIKYIPSATNFIILDLGKRAKEIYNKLLKKGVITRIMSAWKLNNFIRVTTGTVRENKRLINTLKEIL